MTQQPTHTVSLKLTQVCFESERYAELFSGEGTHDAALRLVGQLVQQTQDSKLIVAIVTSGLPQNYLELSSNKTKDTLDQVPKMVADALAKGFDKTGKDKSRKTDESALLASVVRKQQGLELFHDAFQRAYIGYKKEGKGLVVRRLTSSAAKIWLKGLFYKETGEAIASQDFNSVLDALQAIALYDGPQKTVFLRVAHDASRVIVNLANDAREVVVIDSNSYHVTTDSSVIFASSQAMQAIPAPLSLGQPLKELQELWGVSDEIFMLLVIFLLNCLNPHGPYLCLLVEGEQGSGKSLLCSMLKELIDPNQAARLRFPKDERDLMIAAQDNYLLLFDNLSGLRGEMSDALCSLSTRSGFATRKLYSDDELQIFSECRPFILNGIAEYATRPDLIERAISINLPALGAGQRKSEEEMKRRFQELRPRVLGKLYEVVSCALRRFSEVTAPTTVRMADAAKWIAAAEPATDYPAGALVRALEKNQAEAIAERMDNNPVAAALEVILEGGPFVGKVSALFKLMKLDETVAFDRSFPKTAQHLSKKLKQYKAALNKAGINVDFPARVKEGQGVVVWLDGHGNLELAKRMAAEKEKSRKF